MGSDKTAVRGVPLQQRARGGTVQHPSFPVREQAGFQRGEQRHVRGSDSSDLSEYPAEKEVRFSGSDSGDYLSVAVFRGLRADHTLDLRGLQLSLGKHDYHGRYFGVPVLHEK